MGLELFLRYADKVVLEKTAKTRENILQKEKENKQDKTK